MINFSIPSSINYYIENVDQLDHFFVNCNVDRSKVQAFSYATSFDLVEYSDSTLIKRISLVDAANDTFYGGEVLNKKIDDTIHFFTSGFQTPNTEFSNNYHSKYYPTNNTLICKKLPTTFIKTRFSNDSLRLLSFHSDVHQLPNRDLLILGNLYDSIKNSVSCYVLQTNSTLTTIKYSWPVDIPRGTKQIARDGQNIYIVSSSLRYRGVDKIPNTDFSLEVFNYLTDTLPTKYFYSPNDTALPTQDVLTAAYFNGTHFILAGMSDYDPDKHEKYTMEFLTMDKNFNLINRETYTDSTDDFYPLTYSILPHPKDTTTFIMSGTITDPSVSSNSNAFWTTYNAFGNISLPEQKLFRKARIHLFPNPSSGDVQLLYPSEDFKPYKIEVYNSEGKLVHQETVESARQTINLKLPAGAYTLYHTNGSHYEYHPLIIQ